MPSRVSSSSAAISPPISREDRQAEFGKLLNAVAEDFLAARGLGYHLWERELPVTVGGKPQFTVIATDGQRFVLSGEHLNIMRQMDAWAFTGKGKNPAEGWYQAKQATVPLPDSKGRPNSQKR